METFGERLLHVINNNPDYRSISAFARKVGVSNVTLYRIIDGKNEASKKIVDAIFQYFPIQDAVWIQTGQWVINTHEEENKILKTRIRSLEKKLRDVKKLWRNRNESLLTGGVQMEISM